MESELQSWLQKVGIPVKEGRFVSPPSFPYLVYTDKIEISGSDYTNDIEGHFVTLELYAEKIDRGTENKIEDLLDDEGIDYEKERIWISSEFMWQTIYSFEFYKEKEG